ncbi:hypothetical protein BCR42DRAFT_474175 [Absidia repens]|uniref:Uncharacterized protein n=1 Tax=Absidia repens TaxID=90262 RepID=A0A1X2HYE9_9FUNG|nr:hypothetical protein BCR42DRAFT_474175 [Absidia repens]
MSEEDQENKQQPDSSRHSAFLQLPGQTQDEQPNEPDYTSTEVVEAKTAVILLDSATVFKKNEYIHWRLTSMFKPMAIGDKTESMKVLYLSHQRKHNWLSEYKDDDSNSIMMSAPSAPLSSTLFKQPLMEASTKKKRRYLYVVTPRTNVITLTKVCRLVYMMDMSSSLATVGNTKSQILLFEVFNTLRNSLEGIVHPFCIQISSNERIMIRPVLLLTIVADCSQFASNVNVIPTLMNHPTMRVFMQNVQITLENVDQVVVDLYSAFMLFQKDITVHRKQMKRKRSSMGYDLDVDEGPAPSYDRSVFDATSLPASVGVDNGPYAKDMSSKTKKLKRKPKSIKSSSAVWGMGKTGANLTRMLHAGAFALTLLPQQGRSQLILISDGALKSHIHDNTVARQLAEQDIACHIIQIGFNQSFIPGRNFGFLPDVDTLKFLAQATGGTFLYSDECVRLNRPDHDPPAGGEHEKDDEKNSNGTRSLFIQSSIMKKQENSTMDEEMENLASSGEEHHGRRRQPLGESNTTKKRISRSSSTLENDWWWNLDPNIYHRHFVLRESNLEKIRTLTPFHPRHHFHHTRSSASSAGAPTNTASPEPTENDSNQHQHQHQHHHHLRLQQGSSGIMAQTNFPWDPEGTTPPVEWRLLRYREYALPDDFSHVIAARAREGFYLQSVLFDNKCVPTPLSRPTTTTTSTSSSSSSSSENQAAHDKTAGKKKKRKPSNSATSSEERIQITMVLHWKPHVIIEYRLRATWLPFNQDQAQWGTLFSRSTSPQVEVFIRSDAEFAHILQNWNSLRRRAQMMMMMAMTGPRESHHHHHPQTLSNQLFFKGEPQAAQAYTKIEKLKTYLQCLFEGDDLLKDWIDPKNHYFCPWSENHPSPPFSEMDRPSKLKLLNDRFRSFWFSRFSSEDSRVLTRCWYDLDCIDILVGDISPYMDPKLASALNQDFGPNVQESIQQSIAYVVTILKASWADIELTAASAATTKKDDHQQDSDQEDEDRLVPSFVKFIDSTSPSGSDFADLERHPAYCQIKVKHEYGRLVTLRFLFFNANANIRQDMKKKLLIRDDEHFKSDDILFSSSSSDGDMEDGSKKKLAGSSQKIKQSDKISFSLPAPPSPSYPLRQQYQQKSSSWYLPVGLWLTGEHIVHDYLLHSIWSWQTDNYQDSYHRENKMMPVHDLAFQLLCQARLDQGYQLVLPRPDNTHFYQEIAFPHDIYYVKRSAHHQQHRHQKQKGKENDPLCAIQYFIRKDDTNEQGRIITELWVEPSVNHISYYDDHHFHESKEDQEDDDLIEAPITRKSAKNDYDWIKTWTEIPDRRIISHLVTFDQIHAIGRSKGKADFKRTTDDRSKKTKDGNDEEELSAGSMVKMLLPHLFDVSSILKTNSFVLASYHLPCSSAAATKDHDMSPQLDSSTSITKNNKSSQQDLNTVTAAIIIPHNLNRLPSQYQTYGILHHYFEQALEKNSMDGEIVMTQHSPRREFWTALKKAIRECHSGSNMDRLVSLKQMKCYVSIIDPRSFLIVLVPDLEDLVAIFLGTEARTMTTTTSHQRRVSLIESQPNRFDCLLFECVRQKPLRAKQQPDDHHTPVADDPSSVSKEPKRKHHHHHWLSSLLDDEDHKDATIHMQPTDPNQPTFSFSVFSPNPVYCGQFQCNSQPVMSENTQKKLSKVTESYAQAFLRTIYTLLLTHALDSCVTPIISSDLEKAMTICHTTIMKIDITRFVNIMACPSISLCKDMDRRWKMTLDPYFMPIKTSQSQEDANIGTPNTADILLYIPPSLLEPIELSTASSDSITQTAQHPLFLGFNVTHGQTNISSLCEGPTSFDQLKRIMIAFSEKEYEDEDTFLAKSFPDHDDNTGALPLLTLNLVCKSIIADDKKSKSRSSEKKDDDDDDGDACSADDDNNAYLTDEQKMILSQTKLKIEWTFTEQVLHGLLILQMKQQETNREVLRYVVAQLGKSYASSAHQHQTKFEIPLNFVTKNTQLCTELFMDLFEKKRMDGDHVKRLDPYFHVIWSPSSLSSAAAANQMPIDGSGLGISVQEEGGDDEGTTSQSIPVVVPDLYWLIVAVHDCQVEIYYFALSDQANDDSTTLVVDYTTNMIRKIEKQTNQTLLLDMLQETRICSNFLEAPTADTRDQNFKSNDSDSSRDSQSSGEKSSDAGTTLSSSPSQHMNFFHGQFQCPLVYRKEFPLHWRVPLGKALNYLKNDVLHPFMVMNRTDMYVIEREKTIVYCKLNEKTSAMTPLLPNDNKEHEAGSILLAEGGTPMTPASAPVAAATPSTTYSLASNELELAVYGLECPDWIVNDVVNLIENRLMSEVTLEELQTFFARNPSSKPTISDVRFILPFDKRSPQTEILRIPHLVSNPSLLLRFFKRFLLADNLKPFKGLNVLSAITNASSYIFSSENNQYAQSDETDHQDEFSGESYVELQKDHLCFYYNCTKRIPGVSSASELACGQGMAGICMTLRESTMDQGKIITTLPPKNPLAGFNFDPDEIRRSLETELRVASVQNDNPYYVWVDVWTMGSVDDQVLLQRIHDCYRRALCDYFIEETVTIDLASVLLFEAAALQQAVSSDRNRHINTMSPLGPAGGPSHRQLSTLLRKKFINSVVYMLEKSVEWQNPTVHTMKAPVTNDHDWEMPPWCMKDIISHLDNELIQLDPSLESTITWKKLGNKCASFSGDKNMESDDDPTSEWLLYRGGPIFCRNNIQNNIRVVAISGLCEFVEQFGGGGSSPSTHFSPIQQTVGSTAIIGPGKSSATTSTTGSHRPSVQHRYLYHPHHPPYSQKRRTSLKSDPSRKSSASSTVGNGHDPLLPSATSSIKSANFNEQQQQQQQQSRRVSHQNRSRGSSTSFAYPSNLGEDAAATAIHPLSQAPSFIPRADPEKHCFLIMIMDVGRLVMYSYNWAEQQSTRLFNSIFSMAHQQHMRSNVLNSILHQKMGLFHHSLTMENIAHQYLNTTTTTITTTSTGQEKTLISPRSGHHHHHHHHHQPATTQSTTSMKTSAKTAEDGSKAMKDQSTSRPELKKTKSELKVITQTTTQTTSSTPTTPRHLTVADMSIQNIIRMDLPLFKTLAEEPNTRRQRRQRRALSYGGGNKVHVDPLSMANPELNYVLMDTISNPVNAADHPMVRWKGSRSTGSSISSSTNDDLLQRHGIPYLDTYLQHASVVSVHRKALQVYLKWRKRFGGGGGVKTTTTTTTPLASPQMLEMKEEEEDGQEKLTRYEVSEILRSSRLLHFCRAPFFFFTGSAAHDQPTTTEQGKGGGTSSDGDVILDWYRQYLRTFVVHYSAYLEKLNLQVVEFPAGDYAPLSLLPSPILNSSSSDDQQQQHHEKSKNESSLNSSIDENDGGHDQDEDKNNNMEDSLTEDGDGDDDTDLNTSKFDTGIQGLTVEHPSTYLLKVSDAGSIICEVRFTHTFVSVSLYGLHRQQQQQQQQQHNGLSRQQQQSREIRRMHFKKFEQGVGQLKHLIHINSFVYDFHLYYMQHLLTLMTMPPPWGVSVMGTLRRFETAAAAKDPFVDLNYFFKYLYKDHTGYGLNAIRENHRGAANDINGVYLTSTSVTFDENNYNNNSSGGDGITAPTAAWKYTLVLCPMTENTLDPSTLDQNPLETPASVTSTSVLIRYFILAVYQPERTPSSLVKNFWTTPASSSYHPSLIVNARKKIDGIVSKVIKTCKQRFSWRALLPKPLKRDQHHHRLEEQEQDNDDDDSQMDCSHWYQLLLKFQYFSLLGGDTAEPNLVRLVKKKQQQTMVDWPQAFDVFLRLHQNQCRSFMYKGRRHILVYHPHHYMEFLIHIMLGTTITTTATTTYDDNDTIEMEVVRRVPRFITTTTTTTDDYDSSNNNNNNNNNIAPMTEFEQEQVAMVGQSLCYILWKDTKQC